MSLKLLGLQTGTTRPIRMRGRNVPSAIDKRPVDGRVGVHMAGLEGDEQADRSVHGGFGKALYAYPSEHYPFWQTVRAQARVSLWDEALVHGALGENLTLAGLLETQAWIGDVLRFPDCDLAVSAPRFPCFKFDAAMGFEQAGRLMQQSAWCGFYLAVRRPGSLAAGETFEVIAGPREVTIDALFRARHGN